MNDRPEMKYINRYVTDEVCAFRSNAWLNLGIELLGDVAALYSIQSDKTECSTCCSKMFKLWLDRQPEASWRCLIKALKEIHCNNLASDIEKLLSTEKISKGVAKTDPQVSQDRQLTKPSTVAEQPSLQKGMFRHSS